MAINQVLPGSSTTSVRNTLSEIIDYGLGPGESDGINWDTGTVKFNQVATGLGLDGLADQMAGSVARGRINAVIDALGIPAGSVFAYDAATGGVHRGSVGFVRPSTALWNPSGDYQEYGTDVLRRADGVGALLEVGATNQIAEPMNLSASPWGSGGGTAVTVTPTSEMAGLSGWRVTADMNFGRQTQNITVEPSTQYMFSYFCRRGTAVSSDAGLGAGNRLRYNFDTAIVSTQGNISNPMVQDMGDGVYRVYGSYISGPSETSVEVRLYGYWENSGESVDYTGVVLEPGSSLTTPIVGVRNVDSLSMVPDQIDDPLDWHVMYDNDSEEMIASNVTGAYTIDPADLTRPVVKMIWATNA